MITYEMESMSMSSAADNGARMVNIDAGSTSHGSQTETSWVPETRMSTSEEYARFYYQFTTFYNQHMDWFTYCTWIRDTFQIILVAPLPPQYESEFDPGRHSTWN